MYIPIWSLNGERIKVTENNKRLGLIVSVENEEIKNFYNNIKAARNSMFAFLGKAFSYKCKISPTVQVHIWSIYCKPVLRLGLSALLIRPTVMEMITNFHRATLRGFLKLNKYSPVAPLYFLLVELPLEANLHMDVLILFWNVWSNPQTTVFKTTKYILMMTDNTSVSWAAHVRILCQTYHLPDPLALLQGALWSKEAWKTMVQTKITVHHETNMCRKALSNWKLNFLNIQLSGLTGRIHPILFGIKTTEDASTQGPTSRCWQGITCASIPWLWRGAQIPNANFAYQAQISLHQVRISYIS